jgi:hypothetical protein
MVVAVVAACGLDTSGLFDGPADAGGDAVGVTTLPLQDATLPEAAAPPTDAQGPDDATTPGDSPSDDAGASDASDASAPDACPAPQPDASIATITKMAPPPMIDGKLSDWGCTSWTELDDKNAAYVLENGQKIHGEYAVRWDPMNIYVAAHIVVPTLQGTNATAPYDNDAIEIYLTGDNPPTGDYDNQSHQYVVDWHDTIVDYNPNQSSTPNPPHVTAKTLVVPDGWQIEAAIGWQALLASGPGFASGNKIAVDVAFDDGDGTTLKTQLMAMVAQHSITCGCQSCCCGEVSPDPDMPNCDTLCFGVVTLQ